MDRFLSLRGRGWWLSSVWMLGKPGEAGVPLWPTKAPDKGCAKMHATQLGGQIQVWGRAVLGVVQKQWCGLCILRRFLSHMLA